jgi:phosphatidylethanolamine/phosphatidyl-N-methylethanolamine N-methyltransferase
MAAPRLTGAVAPSGRPLARAMADASGPPSDGFIVELGPGTGPVTQALLDRGVDQRRIVMVEYNPQFCRLLQERFPAARMIEGDAYHLKRALAEFADERVSAVVSSLPLLTRPPGDRERLIGEAFALMDADGVFVQFTYGLLSPIPREVLDGRYSAHRGRAIWANLPPARVWTYRLETPARRSSPLPRRAGRA